MATCAACGHHIARGEKFMLRECFVTHELCAEIPQDAWKISLDLRQAERAAQELRDVRQIQARLVARATAAETALVEATRSERATSSTLAVKMRDLDLWVLRENEARVRAERAEAEVRLLTGRLAKIEGDLEIARSALQRAATGNSSAGSVDVLDDVDASEARFALLELDGLETPGSSTGVQHAHEDREGRG